MSNIYKELVPLVHDRLKDDGLAKFICYVNDFQRTYSKENPKIGEMVSSVTNFRMNLSIDHCKICDHEFYTGDIHSREMKRQIDFVNMRHLHELSVHPDTFKYQMFEPNYYRCEKYLRETDKEWNHLQLLVIDHLKSQNNCSWDNEEERKSNRTGRTWIKNHQRLLAEMLIEVDVSPFYINKIDMERDRLVLIWNLLNEVGDSQYYISEFEKYPEFFEEIQKINGIVADYYISFLSKEDSFMENQICEDPYMKYGLREDLRKAAAQYQIYEICGCFD